MPFQATYPDYLISQYVDNLRKNPAISEPIRVNLSRLAGNVAHNLTYSSKIGQFVYHTTDIIMLSGVKQYDITYYIRPLDNFSSYMSTIQQMIDSFVINTSIKSNMIQQISNSWFSTYENNSTLGVKIQYPSNWKRIEYGNVGVVFL